MKNFYGRPLDDLAFLHQHTPSDILPAAADVPGGGYFWTESDKITAGEARGWKISFVSPAPFTNPMELAYHLFKSHGFDLPKQTPKHRGRLHVHETLSRPLPWTRDWDNKQFLRMLPPSYWLHDGPFEGAFTIPDRPFASGRRRNWKIVLNDGKAPLLLYQAREILKDLGYIVPDSLTEGQTQFQATEQLGFTGNLTIDGLFRNVPREDFDGYALRRVNYYPDFIDHLYLSGGLPPRWQFLERQSSEYFQQWADTGRNMILSFSEGDVTLFYYPDRAALHAALEEIGQTITTYTYPQSKVLSTQWFQEIFDQSFGDHRPPTWLLNASMQICRRFMIIGICDPPYIVNLIAMNLQIGDGRSSFDHSAEPVLDALPQLCDLPYPNCHEKKAQALTAAIIRECLSRRIP